MMNGELRPYEEYEKIELPWLSEIPRGWTIKRGKQLFKMVDERTSTGGEELLSVSASYGVVKRKNTNVTMFKAASYVGYKLCWEKDLVVNSLWAWQQGLGFSKYHGIISTAYSVYRLRSEKENSKYFDYLLRSDSYLWELRTRSKGIWKSRYQLHDSSFMDMPFIIPPRPEQDQIVKYLDHKLAKINKFIKAKKKLIAALKEQKQAIINQAVTKGFDSKVRMKPSGIEWLGDIPEHWTMVQLKRLVKTVKTGGTPSGADEKYFEPIGFNWFTPSDFNDELYLSNSNRQLSNVGKSEVNIFPQGTVMMIGIGATMGKISISEKKCSCNQQINAILCSENIIPEFLVYFMRAVRTHIFAIAKYTTLPILNQEETKKIMVPSIPCEEQKKIVLKINESVAVYDAGIKKIEHEIGLVLEYKSSLVSEVVTGKVDVQHVFIEKPKKVGRDESDIDEELTYGGETDIEEGDE